MLVSLRPRPRTFVALMRLYHSNYVRLNWLVPSASSSSAPPSLHCRHRSGGPGDCDLVLSVTERTPYTSTVSLTYLFPEPAGTAQYPDMRVRIYHDAHLAEAQEWAGSHAQPVLKALRTQAERELDQRWARNVMLNKWLEYCVERGHRFSAATRVSTAGA